jgi:hypothetical protein
MIITQLEFNECNSKWRLMMELLYKLSEFASVVQNYNLLIYV